MQRAIELNGVAVDNNKAAFSLGRLAAADPAAAASCCTSPIRRRVHAETLDALIERSARFLTALPGRGLRRALSRARSSGARRARRRFGAGAPLPLTRAVAEQMRKLMAYKDEYEVARLYTDGEFAKRLAEQFEGDDRRSSSTWRRRRW